MPIFMDRHDFRGLTPEQLAAAHAKDLEVQGKYGVRFLTYWYDEERATGFCLIDAPDEATARRVHAEAHGNVATHIIQVDLSAVEAFLGRIADPAADTPGAAIVMGAAFRAVMFTDLVDSTRMTTRLGDARSVEMVRTHDAMVRRSLADAKGREIKHTGDGIMASFTEDAAAVTCGCAIQHAFDAFNRNSPEKLRLRIGIHSGEPVEDSNDLFGATVQIAARICQDAATDSIVVSDVVRRALPDSIRLNPLGARTLRGFVEPVALYEVDWRAP